MNRVKFGVITVSMGCLALLASGFSQAQSNGCPASSDNCVQVTIPSDKSKRPEVSNPVLKVGKKTGTDKTEFSFGLGSVSGVYYVIFKCQDDEPLTLDCRTPAVNKGTGNPAWVIKLTPGGAKSVEVAGSLEYCDTCAAKDGSGSYEYNEIEFKQCMENYCTYPYMVVDDQGERPPLDPVVIVDPR